MLSWWRWACSRVHGGCWTGGLPRVLLLGAVVMHAERRRHHAVDHVHGQGCCMGCYPWHPLHVIHCQVGILDLSGLLHFLLLQLWRRLCTNMYGLSCSAMVNQTDPRLTSLTI